MVQLDPAVPEIGSLIYLGSCLFWSFSELQRFPRKSIRKESGVPFRYLTLRLPASGLASSLGSPAPSQPLCSVQFAASHSLSPSVCTSVLHLCQWPARHSCQLSVSHLISFLSCFFCFFFFLILPSNKSVGGWRARRAARTAMGYWVPPSCDLPACGLCPHPSPLLSLALQPFLLLPQRPPRSGPPGNAIALPD